MKARLIIPQVMIPVEIPRLSRLIFVFLLERYFMAISNSYSLRSSDSLFLDYSFIEEKISLILWSVKFIPILLLKESNSLLEMVPLLSPSSSIALKRSLEEAFPSYIFLTMSCISSSCGFYFYKTRSVILVLPNTPKLSTSSISFSIITILFFSLAGRHFSTSLIEALISPPAALNISSTMEMLSRLSSSLLEFSCTVAASASEAMNFPLEMAVFINKITVL